MTCFFKQTGDKMTSEVFILNFNDGAGANLWSAAGLLYEAQGAVTSAIESLRVISAHDAVIRGSQSLAGDDPECC